MDAWFDYKRAKGRPEATIATYRDMLAPFLGHVMNRSVRYLLGRGDELYAAAQVFPRGHRRAGQRRAADTHRNGLGRASELCDWLVKKRWLPRNPFAEVESVGGRSVGADKVHLTTDEARALDQWCQERIDDDKALLTLCYLVLGTRASELCKRNVRDLDDDGSVLRIGKTKTANGRRGLGLPEHLGAALLARTAGRAGDEPLFRNLHGRRLTRALASLWVKETCAAAGVTVVSPHGLRRTGASIAEEINQTGRAISEYLGHANTKAQPVTHRSYVGREVAAQAKVDRTLRALSRVRN